MCKSNNYPNREDSLMNEQTKNELQIIGGGVAWFAILIAGLTSLTVIGGGLYLGLLGSKMYR